jgi:hypothetical protein
MGGVNALPGIDRLAAPEIFWPAAILLLVALFVPLARRRRSLALNARFWLPRVDLRSRRTWWPAVPVVLITLLLAAALAGPEIATRPTSRSYGKPVMVVFDISGSMEMKDFGQSDSNLAKGRAALADLFSRNTGASFGLLLFGSENYMARYFTSQPALLQDSVDNRPDPNIESGTEIAAALGYARAFLTERVDAMDKAMILISDMEQDNKAHLRTGVEIRKALAAGIKVYIIATTQDLQQTLNDIPSEARVTGLTIIAVDDKQGREQIAGQLAAMHSAPLYEDAAVRRSLIPWLLAPALGLVGLGLVLSETRFRKLP